MKRKKNKKKAKIYTDNCTSLETKLLNNDKNIKNVNSDTQ